jgi:hypothetical protein
MCISVSLQTRNLQIADQIAGRVKSRQNLTWTRNLKILLCLCKLAICKLRDDVKHGAKALRQKNNTQTLRKQTEHKKPTSRSAAAAEKEEESVFPSLTWQERLIGCVSCMTMGYIYSFGSLFCIKYLILGMPSLVGVVGWCRLFVSYD